MGKSSKDKRDAYYRLAKEQGWRARSAFKLIQLDEQFDLFNGVTRVVDLCAAPGSWSQVLSRVLVKGEGFGRRRWEEKQKKNDDIVFGRVKFDPNEEFTEELKPRENVRIVAIDLQPISPLPGITTLVGDITHRSTPPRILAALDPPSDDDPPSSNLPTQTNPPTRPLVDLILSDGAPDVTGLHDLDIYVQSQLLFSALQLVLRILKPGGTFVAKIFRGKDIDLIYAQMRCFFKQVSCAKPRSSRASSLEAFIVCQGFEIPKGFDVESLTSLTGPFPRRKMKPPPPATTPAAREGGEEEDPTANPPSSSSKGQNNQQEKDEKEPTPPTWQNGQKRTLRPDGITILEFEKDETNDTRWIAPFVACGDLSAWDADATYHLPKDRVSLDPVQPPVAPPYKRALEVRRQLGGFYGKTGKGKEKEKEDP